MAPISSSIEQHLYVIMWPNYALVASNLPPEEFGRHYTVGSSRYYHGQVIFAQIQDDYRHEFFPDRPASQGSRPESRRAAQAHQVHRDLPGSGAHQTLRLHGPLCHLGGGQGPPPPAGTLRAPAPEGLHPDLPGDLPVQHDRPQPHEPARVRALHHRPGATEERPGGDVHPDRFQHRRVCRRRSRRIPSTARPSRTCTRTSCGTRFSSCGPTPNKRLKGISLDSVLGKISFLKLRTGFWIASHSGDIFYPIPDNETLKRDHAEFVKTRSTA